jgi:serine/threonine protein kinase
MAEFSPLSTIRRLAAGQTDPSRSSLLGRFELRRILGQGAQSVVWLAFDPRLEREVAIKLMKVGEGASIADIPQWLQEARHVSRLSHPNIVPVFEADVQDLHPYLVFEYVPGQTLADLIAGRGAMPAVEAADLMVNVLDALAAAHAAGVIHRDVKPSNVLVDESGRARVMDFGIAAPVQDGRPDVQRPAYTGTPGYMAPEVAQGQAATPAVDVFSAGMVLAEMLAGQPLVAERDPYRAVYRILHEPLTLPATVAPDVDDALRGIVMRAIDRDPAQRHPGAQAFRDALMAWSARASGATVQDNTDGGQAQVNSTLAFLLRRMRHTADFPAMSDSVARIQGIASSDTESLSSLTNEILKDVALTNKLLRMVNSAHFARGGGSISTVSRAVSLVGFNGIRNMALGLVLLEHMQDKAHANVLKDEFVRCLMAGSIAGELCTLARESEEAFIGAMFQNLGRLLAEFYFPDEARKVRAMVQATRQPVSEPQAATQVLGVDFETLGVGVAKAWGLPDTIQRCMRKPGGQPPAKVPTDAGERLRWISAAANDIADVMLHSGTAEVEARLGQTARHYARSLGLTADEMAARTLSGRKKLIELARAMRLQVLPGSGAARLLKLPQQAAPPSEAGDSLYPPVLHASHEEAAPDDAAVQRDAHFVAQTLTAGIQDVTNAMVEDFKLSDVLRMILETMLRAMSFERIVLCMRDPKTDTLTGRFGLGEGVGGVVRAFQVPLKPAQPDLFAAVCNRGADTLISDATEPRIAGNLPAWYCRTVNATTFLLLPLHIKGKPVGLIYADMGAKTGLKLDEKELSLLRTLRNQAVMAFKQSA